MFVIYINITNYISSRVDSKFVNRNVINALIQIIPRCSKRIKMIPSRYSA